MSSPPIFSRSPAFQKFCMVPRVCLVTGRRWRVANPYAQCGDALAKDASSTRAHATTSIAPATFDFHEFRQPASPFIRETDAAP